MSFYLIVAWIVIPNKISGLRSNLGCAPYSQSWVFFFFKMFRIHLFCFITQLVKKLLQWSLYEVIEDIMPIVLNTKRPLSDIWLLSYEQNSFWCFLKILEFCFFFQTTKTVLLIPQQPDIAQRLFCIQNEGQDILYLLIYSILL